MNSGAMPMNEQLCLVIAAILISSMLGCASKPPPRAAQARSHQSAISNTDPCATRLHDICGPLLFFYATNHKLPGSLDELRKIQGFEDVEYVCPVTGLAYIYVPDGIPAPNQPGAKIVLYDAAPSAQGLRWAVSIIEPPTRGAGALITKVIAVPESYFAAGGS